MESIKQQLDKIPLGHQEPDNIKFDNYQISDWKFEFKSDGILPSKQLDEMCDLLILNKVPDVVFGYNSAKLINTKHNFVYEINPRDSLMYSNFKVQECRLIKDKFTATSHINHIKAIPLQVKIKHSEAWKIKKQNIKPELGGEIKIIQQISDPFFSSSYMGTFRELKYDDKQWFKLNIETSKEKINLDPNSDKKLVTPYAEYTEEPIPIENLKENNPILWHSQIGLWEDELGDNGQTMSEFRFRTMKNCFFGLLRHYLRIDGELIRIFDTRIYHDFDKNYILREFQSREGTFEGIMKKGFQFTPKWMIDEGQSHLVYNYLDVTLVSKDKIVFA